MGYFISTLNCKREEEKEEIIPRMMFSGNFRVCETNSVYDWLPRGKKGPGWIFVSNEVDIDEAIKIQKKYEDLKNGLKYTIVPV